LIRIFSATDFIHLVFVHRDLIKRSNNNFKFQDQLYRTVLIHNHYLGIGEDLLGLKDAAEHVLRERLGVNRLLVHGALLLLLALQGNCALARLRLHTNIRNYKLYSRSSINRAIAEIKYESLPIFYDDF